MRIPVLVVLALAASLFGADSKIQMQDLPPAVRTTVREQTRNATLMGLAKENQKGKTVYELETKVSGRGRDLVIAADGKVLSVEEEVALDSIPAPAKTAIEKKAAGGKVTKVESLTEGGKVSYEAAITRKGKQLSVTVTPGGSPVK